MIVTSGELDAFVRAADDAGGPNGAAVMSMWEGFKYVPSFSVNPSLDPDGEAYAGQMMALYEEIAGRKIDQSVTEMTFPDVDRLALLESPYADFSPRDRAVHYLRLSKAMHDAAVPKGGRVLDMGCGWGLSSEFLAQLGLEVVAVDINPLFVELVNRRAKRLDLNIRSRCVSFEEYEGEPAAFDAVLFYECLHHAVRPGALLSRIRKWLKPDAKLILAGEPIQHSYWPHWGLRLDPLSVYCIRKFGWFESGWSANYLQRIIARTGLIPQVLQNEDPVIGTYVIASTRHDLDAKTMATFAAPDEWWLEKDYLISGRRGSQSAINVFVPPGASGIGFEIHLFRHEPLDVRLRAGSQLLPLVLTPGRNDVHIEIGAGSAEVRFEFGFVPWCPDEVLHNGDVRRLGFHLKRLTVEF